jgi:hypothetical protein
MKGIPVFKARPAIYSIELSKNTLMQTLMQTLEVHVAMEPGCAKSSIDEGS